MILGLRTSALEGICPSSSITLCTRGPDWDHYRRSAFLGPCFSETVLAR